jgi:hypothetical protein
MAVAWRDTSSASHVMMVKEKVEIANLDGIRQEYPNFWEVRAQDEPRALMARTPNKTAVIPTAQLEAE